MTTHPTSDTMTGFQRLSRLFSPPVRPFSSKALALGMFGALCLQGQGVAAQGMGEVTMDEAATTEVELDSKAGKFRLDIGVGVKGGINGSWALEVPESEDMFKRISPESKAFYSQFGLGGDVGLSVDFRALGIVGIETGFRVSYENADGFNEQKQANTGEVLVKVTQEQQSTSLRIPLLLKLSTPDGVVRPTFGFGVEFAIQTDSTIDFTSERVSAEENPRVIRARKARNLIEESTYTLLTLAVGIEIDAGPVKIPIELVAQYNLNYGGDSFEDRVRLEDAPASGDFPSFYYYDGMYQGHAMVRVGLLYDLNLYL